MEIPGWQSIDADPRGIGRQVFQASSVVPDQHVGNLFKLLEAMGKDRSNRRAECFI